jgi:hypothetical protein
MLDIRTLLLGAPEDRYEPTLAIRAAERAVFPVLQQPRPAPDLVAERILSRSTG